MIKKNLYLVEFYNSDYHDINYLVGNDVEDVINMTKENKPFKNKEVRRIEFQKEVFISIQDQNNGTH